MYLPKDANVMFFSKPENNSHISLALMRPCTPGCLKQLLFPFSINFEPELNRGKFLQQIRMAEIEQASLKSEQLSDKSSSPALPDDLSLDERTVYQLLAREGKVCMGTLKP